MFFYLENRVQGCTFATPFQAFATPFRISHKGLSSLERLRALTREVQGSWSSLERLNLEDVISAFVSIMEYIFQDRKGRLGRNVHLDGMTVWSDAAPILTGTLDAYVKEDKLIENE